ncbi:MAG: hypothetical protein MAG795_00601 [Candidatus Woesearchaeota archaeon]|nr:hypothetical protein [Candidatus Woesearchaeota archaeon]
MWQPVTLLGRVVGDSRFVRKFKYESKLCQKVKATIVSIEPETYNNWFEQYTFKREDYGNSTLIIPKTYRWYLENLLNVCTEKGEELIGKEVLGYYQGHTMRGFTPNQS